MPEPMFKPPYYAVIFTAQRTEVGEEAYGETADLMARLAAESPGYLGVETTRNPETGLGITVSYWRDEDSIRIWKQHLDHTAAREMGRKEWYSAYSLRVARIEREYDFQAPNLRTPDTTL